MYIFGGRDDDNMKLNDLWRFDIATNVWQEIKQSGNAPTPRSGHSCDIFEGQYLIIFGGILEITKELNDLHLFDLTKKKWVTLFEETNSPLRGGKDGSPSFHDPNGEGLQSSLGGASLGGASPSVYGKKSMMHSSIA